jgi:hypothetical protein
MSLDQNKLILNLCDTFSGCFEPHILAFAEPLARELLNTTLTNDSLGHDWLINQLGTSFTQRDPIFRIYERLVSSKSDSALLSELRSWLQVRASDLARDIKTDRIHWDHLKSFVALKLPASDIAMQIFGPDPSQLINTARESYSKAQSLVDVLNDFSELFRHLPRDRFPELAALNTKWTNSQNWPIHDILSDTLLGGLFATKSELHDLVFRLKSPLFTFLWLRSVDSMLSSSDSPQIQFLDLVLKSLAETRMDAGLLVGKIRDNKVTWGDFDSIFCHAFGKDPSESGVYDSLSNFENLADREAKKIC